MHPKDTPIPLGLCQCGCGQPTKIADRTGDTVPKGQYRPFLRGHNNLKSATEYIVEPGTGCWIWQRTKDRHGYGRLVVNGKRRFAHQVMFERYKGPIPEGTEPDHICPFGPNKSCVNPDHLEPVLHKVNCRRGSRSRLTPGQAADIRATPRPLTRETAEALAERYGMSIEGIRKVVSGQRWRD